MIRKCNQTNPFTVNNMAQEDFVSVGEMLKFATIRKTTVEGEKVEWLKIKWIQVRKPEPLKVYFKYTVNEDMPFSCVSFKKKGRRLKTDYALAPLFSQPRALSKEKVADLTKLMKYVFPVYHGFYTMRTSAVTGEQGEPGTSENRCDEESCD